MWLQSLLGFSFKAGSINSLYRNISLSFNMDKKYRDYIFAISPSPSSKRIYFVQRTCSCLLDTWKKKCQVPITSVSLHWAIYSHDPVYIFAWQGSSSSEHAKCAYIIYYYICFTLCAHVLYFDAGKFLIKLFSLIHFTVSVVRQQNEYEIVTETRSIKTT